MSMNHRKFALVGSNGMLALKVCEQASAAGYEVVGFDLPNFDITNRVQVLSEMERVQPAIIVNCAAYTNVDGCESQETLATLVNGAGAGNLAHVARALGATLVHISTDYVFDGNKAGPYVEEDTTGPQSAYGRSKLAGEQAILASGLERYFIIRTSWLYGPGGKNFVETILRLATERDELRIVADQVGSPTFTGDLAAAIFSLLASNASDQPPCPESKKVSCWPAAPAADSTPDPGGQQAAAAGLRQADDLLSAVHPDDGGDRRHPDHLHAARHPALRGSCSATAAASGSSFPTPCSPSPRGSPRPSWSARNSSPASRSA
jgi:dTDP-4-dehydrorhamnose reductase